MVGDSAPSLTAERKECRISARSVWYRRSTRNGSSSSSRPRELNELREWRRVVNRACSPGDACSIPLCSVCAESEDDEAANSAASVAMVVALVVAMVVVLIAECGKLEEPDAWVVLRTITRGWDSMASTPMASRFTCHDACSSPAPLPPSLSALSRNPCGSFASVRSAMPIVCVWMDASSLLPAWVSTWTRNG